MAWPIFRPPPATRAPIAGDQWSRLGAPEAITALAHKLARILYNVMRYGVAYMRQTEEAYAEQVQARLEKQLRRRAAELGYELHKVEPAAEPAVAE